LGNNRPREKNRVQGQFEQHEKFKKRGKSSSLQLSSYNRFHILANCVIQAGIPDQEDLKKDRKMILREEKAKKKKKKKNKDGIYKKNSGRIIERSNHKNCIRKSRYIRGN